MVNDYNITDFPNKLSSCDESSQTDVSRTCPACVSGAVAWVGGLQPVLHHSQQLLNLTANTSCKSRHELGIEKIYNLDIG